MFEGKYLWGHMFSFLLSKYLVMGWLGYVIGTFITFKETVKQVSKVLDWTEGTEMLFTTLNLSRTYPTRLLSPTGCWKFLAKDIKIPVLMLYLTLPISSLWCNESLSPWNAFFASSQDNLLSCFSFYRSVHIFPVCPIGPLLLFQRSKWMTVVGVHARCSALLCLCTLWVAHLWLQLYTPQYLWSVYISI